MRKSLISLALISLLTANFAFAETIAPAQANLTELANSSQLVQQIKQAKILLQNVNLNYALNPHYKTVKAGKGKKAKTKQVLTNYTLDAKDIALAILNPSTGQILVTKGMQQDEDFTFPDQNFDIDLVNFNGVNSQFQVNKPAGGIVIAIKYLVTGPTSGSQSSILSAMDPAVYVPYTSQLNQPDVTAYGQAYLNSQIKEAAAELGNIPSVSQPGETVVQAVKPSLIKALLYAEHMDTTEFIYTPDTQKLIDKVNVLYAGNEGDTFKYSGSSAGALGIAQFIPSTYQVIVNSHPDAHLIPAFEDGMRNHVNAIKAEYLLIDDYIAQVHTRIPDQFNPAYAWDYGAASYNGGVGRVAKAVQTYGQNWTADHTAQINSLQASIGAQQGAISQLRSQLKHAKKKADKATLKTQIQAAQVQMSSLQNQLSSVREASLKNETVLYLEKMHKLIQIFNDDQL